MLHILLDVAVMICVLLSDPLLPHSPTPLPALVVGASLLVLDMVGEGPRGYRWGAIAGELLLGWAV